MFSAENLLVVFNTTDIQLSNAPKITVDKIFCADYNP